MLSSTRKKKCISVKDLPSKKNIKKHAKSIPHVTL